VSGKTNFSIPYNKITEIQVQNADNFSLLEAGGAFLFGGLIGADLYDDYSSAIHYLIVSYNDDFGKGFNSVFILGDTVLAHKELMVRMPKATPATQSPLDVLKMRFVKGEITQQYEEMKKVLGF
jgi:hypothetical protein